MKVVLSLLFIVLAAFSGLSQKPDETLATANGLTFTVSALPEELRRAYLNQNAVVAAERSRLFTEFVRDRLIEAEERATSTTRDAILSAEFRKIPEPTAAQIKAVYDGNRSVFGERAPEQVRSQIVAFLNGNAEQKALNELTERLKAKHKYTPGKDINSADLKPSDTIFSVEGKAETAAEFTKLYEAQLYDARAEILHHVIQELEGAIFSALIAQEAKARTMDPGDLIAAEITNKLRDFTDGERAGLEAGLKKRLYDKYAVKILVREPPPVAHDVTADDDPVFGPPAAPVTVIMFSDFQCSACAKTHPVLKSVLAAYGGKVRLVVRDFPLEGVHENAFRAARAANSANKQGKYFEYIELLYRNQNSLDDASLKAYAAEVGLNVKQFEIDFTSDATAAEIRKDMAAGLRTGAGGTPTIFVNGVKLHHLSAEGFRSAIDSALARSGVK